MKIIALILFPLIPVLFLSATQINEDEPLKGQWDLKPQKIWEIYKYGKKSIAIANVAAVLDDDTMAVYDYKYKTNYIFDHRGQFVASFGPKGEGPGEVKYQNHVFAGKELFIVGEHAKLHYFNKKGSYIKSTPLKSSWGTFKCLINNDRFLSERSGPKGIELAWISLKGQSKNIIKTMGEDGKANFYSSGRTISIIIPPLTPTIIYTINHANKQILFGKNDTYRIHVIDYEGKNQRQITLKRKKTPLTRKMKRKLNNEMHLSKKMWARFPKELTYYNHFQVEKGLILVHLTNFEEFFKEQIIDIFSLNGKYLYQAIFRADPGEEIHATSDYKIMIKNQHLYAAIQAKNGDMKIVKYKISLPAD